MNKQPKVSIVIPVYNGANYVEEAIKCALNQTYKNIEIIVVNDGSTDNTKQVCEKYKDKIRYFDKENGGVSTALNLAISKMTGDYFSWLSHDDLIYPNKLEEEIPYAREDTIILSDYDLIDENDNRLNRVILNHELIEHSNQAALLNGQINGITLLIPKKAFDDCGDFDVDLRCTQDYEMWFRMMLKGYKFKHIPKVLTATRIHDLSQTETSPKVLTEGNKLWTDFVEKTPLALKKQMSRTEYGYYRDMYMFLLDTPYTEACNRALELCNEIENKSKIPDDKISVIVPIYDESMDVIKRAVNSILNQTYKNIEILLVNDNPEVIKKTNLKEILKHKEVKYLENKKNAGVSHSRNYAMDQATGKYIAFLDADDEYKPEKLETQHKIMVLADSVFSHTSYIRKDKEESVIPSGKENGYKSFTFIYSCTVATPTVMLRKDFMDKYKLRYNENIGIGEDTCLWLDILSHTQILGINEPYTIVHTNSDSSAYSSIKQAEGLYNILNYVTSREDLKDYQIAIARLAKEYADYTLDVYGLSGDLSNNDVIDKYNLIINSWPWKLSKPLRMVYKTLRSLKHNGVKTTARKIKKKLTKK